MSSRLALTLPLFQQVIESRTLALERSAQTLDVFLRQRLQNDASTLFRQRDPRTLANAQAAAKTRRNHELPFACNDARFKIHGILSIKFIISPKVSRDVRYLTPLS